MSGTILLDGHPHRLEPTRLLGSGGEAEVYAVAGRAVKVFKGPAHPDWRDEAERTAARTRRAALPARLGRFPLPLPAAVVQPEQEVRDVDGALVGYAMALVADATPLGRATAPRGPAAPALLAARAGALVALGELLAAVHRAGAVVGDVHDRNVLLTADGVRLIDADSFQTAGWPCLQYTERFLDPRRLAPAAPDAPLLPHRPPDADSDWYAFALLVCGALLGAHPYDGVHRPAAGARCGPAARLRARLTLFRPAVRYPQPARPPAALPPALLAHLAAVLHDDRRGPFPLALLTGARWTACAACGLAHARAACPRCAPAAPRSASPGRPGGRPGSARPGGERPTGRDGAPPGVVDDAAGARATLLAAPPGHLVAAAGGTGGVRWLALIDGAWRREDGAAVPGAARARQTALVAGGATALAADGVLAIHRGGSCARHAIDAAGPGRAPACAADGGAIHWLAGGRLLAEGPHGAPVALGATVPGQARLWLAGGAGVLCERAGALAALLLFAPGRPGLRAAALPHAFWAGRPRGLWAVPGAAGSWLFLLAEVDGALTQRIAALAPDGTVRALAAVPRGAVDPRATLDPRGALAAGDALLVPTDDGVLRLAVVDGTIAVTRRFPATAAHVSAATRLLPAPGGLYLVEERRVLLLQLGA